MEEKKSPKEGSQSVMVFSIIGMLCFIVAIVGFMVIIKRRQDKNEEKSAKNDCEKMPEKKWIAFLCKNAKNYPYLEFDAHLGSHRSAILIWDLFRFHNHIEPLKLESLRS